MLKAVCAISLIKIFVHYDFYDILVYLHLMTDYMFSLIQYYREFFCRRLFF